MPNRKPAVNDPLLLRVARRSPRAGCAILGLATTHHMPGFATTVGILIGIPPFCSGMWSSHGVATSVPTILKLQTSGVPARRCCPDLVLRRPHPVFTTKFSGVSSNVRMAEIADIGCMIKLFLCRRERWAAERTPTGASDGTSRSAPPLSAQ